MSPPGRAAVAVAQGLDLSLPARLRAARAINAHSGSLLGPLALDQALLRSRALVKHPYGDRLWWTAEALEQSSSYAVAVHRSHRYSDLARGTAEPVLDLGCSVGGDLLALAATGPVVGVDLDQARLLLARANTEALGLTAALVRADLQRWEPPAGAVVFADPARRAGGRRVFDPRHYTPSLDQVLGWAPTLRALGVKVAPGIDYTLLPAEIEVEIVSLNGDVKEAVLWAGDARRGSPRMATLLTSATTGSAATDPGATDPGATGPGASGGRPGRTVGPPRTLTGRGAPPPPVRPPGRYLLDLDGAVVRAHLVAEAAAEVGGWLLDPTIAYVSADAAVPTPWGRWYEVLETMPFGLKALRERLRAHDAGPLVVKKRGTAVEPDELRRRLRLKGSREVTVVLTRMSGRQVAMVVRPPRRTDPG